MVFKIFPFCVKLVLLQSVVTTGQSSKFGLGPRFGEQLSWSMAEAEEGIKGKTGQIQGGTSQLLENKKDTGNPCIKIRNHTST